MKRATSDNPLGLGLAVVGALTIAISTFLPLDQPTNTFARIENNTLIQHGDILHGGWALIVLSLAIAVSGYRVSRQSGRTKWWLPLLFSAVAVVEIVSFATSEDLRTLYPVGPGGVIDSSQPGLVAPLGIAVYVAGAGVAAALIGALMLRPAVGEDDSEFLSEDGVEAKPQPATKKCPDCAETILADAKVCKHCGYRFASAAPSSTPSPAPVQPTNRQKPVPSAQPEPRRTGGLKGFVQDWNSVPAWQKPVTPEGKARRKAARPKAQDD